MESYNKYNLEDHWLYKMKNYDEYEYNLEDSLYKDNIINDRDFYKKIINKYYKNPHEDIPSFADDSSVLGTLRIKDGKLLLSNLKDEVIVLCDLSSEDAASQIIAAIAKIQLKGEVK